MKTSTCSATPSRAFCLLMLSCLETEVHSLNGFNKAISLSDRDWLRLQQITNQKLDDTWLVAIKATIQYFNITIFIGQVGQVDWFCPMAKKDIFSSGKASIHQKKLLVLVPYLCITTLDITYSLVEYTGEPYQGKLPGFVYLNQYGQRHFGNANHTNSRQTNLLTFYFLCWLDLVFLLSGI